MSVTLRSVYARLLAAYGPQGWWPLPSMAGKRGFDSRGYHSGGFRWPRSGDQRFEIVVGAILTQNTAWTNVEKALERLRSAGVTQTGGFPASLDVPLVAPDPFLRVFQPEGKEAEDRCGSVYASGCAFPTIRSCAGAASFAVGDRERDRGFHSSVRFRAAGLRSGRLHQEIL